MSNVHILLGHLILIFSLSSSGSIRISSQLCLQRISRNYKSQILPSHRHDKIPLTDWRQKRGKRQKKRRKRTEQVCINGGGSEKNSFRVTVAMEMCPAASPSWTTVWICSREVMALDDGVVVWMIQCWWCASCGRVGACNVKITTVTYAEAGSPQLKVCMQPSDWRISSPE